MGRCTAHSLKLHAGLVDCNLARWMKCSIRIGVAHRFCSVTPNPGDYCAFFLNQSCISAISLLFTNYVFGPFLGLRILAVLQPNARHVDCALMMGDHPAHERDVRIGGPVPEPSLQHRAAMLPPELPFP